MRPQGDSIENSDFTFEKFVTLYHKICPRNDIEDLFQSMWELNLIQIRSKNQPSAFPSIFLSDLINLEMVIYLYYTKEKTL